MNVSECKKKCELNLQHGCLYSYYYVIFARLSPMLRVPYYFNIVHLKLLLLYCIYCIVLLQLYCIYCTCKYNVCMQHMFVSLNISLHDTRASAAAH